MKKVKFKYHSNPKSPSKKKKKKTSPAPTAFEKAVKTVKPKEQTMATKKTAKKSKGSAKTSKAPSFAKAKKGGFKRQNGSERGIDFMGIGKKVLLGFVGFAGNNALSNFIGPKVMANDPATGKVVVSGAITAGIFVGGGKIMPKDMVEPIAIGSSIATVKAALAKFAPELNANLGRFGGVEISPYDNNDTSGFGAVQINKHVSGVALIAA